MLRVAGAALALVGGACAAAPEWWWREALASPPIRPTFDVVAKHVCGRRAACAGDAACVWDAGRAPHRHDRIAVAFGPACARGGDGNVLPLYQHRPPRTARHRAEPRNESAAAPRELEQFPGLGYYGRKIAEALPRYSPAAAPRHYFDEGYATNAIYLRRVAGLVEGYAASLYCHKCGNAHGAACATIAESDARGAYECFQTPPLDAWFGFDALPLVSARAAYAAARRSTLVACGRRAADARLEVAVHVRLGDIYNADRRRNSTAHLGRSGLFVVNALSLVARLPARPRVVVVSDSSPRTLAAFLGAAGVAADVGRDACVGAAAWRRRGTNATCAWVAGDPNARCATISKHGQKARRACVACGECAEPTGDDVAALARASALGVAFDVQSGGNPLVGLHCLVGAELVLREAPGPDASRFSNFLRFALALTEAAVVEVPVETDFRTNETALDAAAALLQRRLAAR